MAEDSVDLLSSEVPPQVKPSTRNKRDKNTYASQAGVKKEKFPKRTKKNFEGSVLISKLWTAMAEKGDTPRELAIKLDMSYSHLMLLGKGQRNASGLEKKHYDRCAEYLNVPVAQVALLAEFFKPTDFYLSSTIEERIEMVFAELKRDPLVGGFAMKDDVWHDLPISARFLIAVLYENGGKTQLLDAAKIVRVKQPA